MTHAPSCVAGVVTPPAAIASSIAPVNDCSLTPGAQLRSGRVECVFGDSERTAQHSDLVCRLDPPGRAQCGLGVDQFGVGERHRQQLRECRCQRVGSDATEGLRAGQLLEDVDQRHRVPGQPVEMIVADLVGDALVPCAVQVDLTRVADHLADRAERPGARHPQLGGTGDVPDIGLAPEHKDVDVVHGHLLQHPLPAAAAQSLCVRQDLGSHHARP